MDNQKILHIHNSIESKPDLNIQSETGLEKEKLHLNGKSNVKKRLENFYQNTGQVQLHIISNIEDKKLDVVINSINNLTISPLIILYTPNSKHHSLKEIKHKNIHHIDTDNPNSEKEIYKRINDILSYIDQNKKRKINIESTDTVLESVYASAEYNSENITLEDKLNLFATSIRRNLNFDECLITSRINESPIEEEIIAYSSNNNTFKTGDIINYDNTHILNSTTPESKNGDAILQLTDEQIRDVEIQHVDGIGTYIASPITFNNKRMGYLHLLNEQKVKYPLTEDIIENINIYSNTIAQDIVKNDIEKDLERQLSKLKEFKQIITHDLISPLTVAKGRSRIAKDKHSNDEHIQKTHNAINRMETMIEGTTRLLKAGELEEKEKVEIADVAKESWKILNTKEATLTIDDNFTLHADKEQLQTILENFFKNSIEHAGPNCNISIGSMQPIPTSTRVDPHDKFKFYVRDDGDGLDPDIEGKIFKKKESTKDDSEETGFGMAIIKTIVDAHGWEIDIDEFYNNGAGFVISNVN